MLESTRRPTSNQSFRQWRRGPLSAEPAGPTAIRWSSQRRWQGAAIILLPVSCEFYQLPQLPANCWTPEGVVGIRSCRMLIKLKPPSCSRWRIWSITRIHPRAGPAHLYGGTWIRRFSNPGQSLADLDGASKEEQDAHGSRAGKTTPVSSFMVQHPRVTQGSISAVGEVPAMMFGLHGNMGEAIASEAASTAGHVAAATLPNKFANQGAQDALDQAKRIIAGQATTTDRCGMQRNDWANLKA